jgi:hypothetical protein
MKYLIAFMMLSTSAIACDYRPLTLKNPGGYPRVWGSDHYSGNYGGGYYGGYGGYGGYKSYGGYGRSYGYGRGLGHSYGGRYR